MNKFTMTGLYSYNGYHFSLYLESEEETLFVLHTDHNGEVGLTDHSFR